MDKGSGRQTTQYEEKQTMTCIAAIPTGLIVCDVHDDVLVPEMVLKYPFTAVFKVFELSRINSYWNF